MNLYKHITEFYLLICISGIQINPLIFNRLKTSYKITIVSEKATGKNSYKWNIIILYRYIVFT